MICCTSRNATFFYNIFCVVFLFACCFSFFFQNVEIRFPLLVMKLQYFIGCIFPVSEPFYQAWSFSAYYEKFPNVNFASRRIRISIFGNSERFLFRMMYFKLYERHLQKTFVLLFCTYTVPFSSIWMT